MKRRILALLSLLLIGGLIIYGNGLGLFDKKTAYAVGDLTVDWGIGIGDVGPIFNISNFAPGETESRDVDVTNGAISSRPVGVRGIETSEIGSISGVLNIVISKGGNDLYGGTSPTGPKTLAEFFTESSGPDGIPLSNLGPGSSTTYTFKITFDQNAGNEFQNTNVVFDLKIGISIPVPAECSDIDFDLSGGLPIFGTSGNDRINGTSGNDLIFAFEGNDKIFGHGGDDCIVSGPGNDEARGETGNDVIFGNERNDLLIGAVGNDKIFGGSGDDNIRGENNDDYIFGNEGNDKITGGNGNDLIDGGDNNDDLSGENGQDQISGGSGNDKLTGGAGSDTLLGNGGIDNANGQSGTDTCDAELETNCEL